MVFRVVTWRITVIIGAVPALCENAPLDAVRARLRARGAFMGGCCGDRVSQLREDVLLAPVVLPKTVPDIAEGILAVEPHATSGLVRNSLSSFSLLLRRLHASAPQGATATRPANSKRPVLYSATPSTSAAPSASAFDRTPGAGGGSTAVPATSRSLERGCIARGPALVVCGSGCRRMCGAGGGPSHAATSRPPSNDHPGTVITRASRADHFVEQEFKAPERVRVRCVNSLLVDKSTRREVVRSSADGPGGPARI